MVGVSQDRWGGYQGGNGDGGYCQCAYDDHADLRSGQGRRRPNVSSLDGEHEQPDHDGLQDGAQKVGRAYGLGPPGLWSHR
jgi:hypothetical protein